MKRNCFKIIGVITLFTIFFQNIAFSLTPDTLLYEGRLLNPTGVPIITTHSFRFSFWSSEDFVSTDLDILGQIELLAPTYSGWQEVQHITPNSNGTFSIKLGSTTPLPLLNPLIHKYLQVEVKAFADPDTSYELMDINGDSGVDAIDRKELSSTPYAKLGDFTIGSLDEEFFLDYDNTVENNATGEIKLSFGQNLGKFLSYDYDNTTFTFNDNLLIQGNLDVTGDSLVQGDSTVQGDTFLNGNATIGGVIIGGTNSVQITDTLGNLDGTTLQSDSVQDGSIDFGTGLNQVDGSDLPLVDNFTYSNGVQVQEVLEDIDSELININTNQTQISGTTQNSFTLDTDDTGGDITLQFGTTLSKQLFWDSVNNIFTFNDNLSIQGDLDITGDSLVQGDSTVQGDTFLNGNATIDGVIIGGTNSVQITDTLGNLDGTTLQGDSVQDGSIDFGTGLNQVDGSDIPLVDNFTYSNGFQVQEVLEDLDFEISNISSSQSNISGTTQNTFTLDTDDTGGDVVLQFGTTLSKQLYWDSINSIFKFNDNVFIDGSLELMGVIQAGSSQIQITDSFGYLDGNSIQTDSVNDTALDFGFGANQISAEDILTSNPNGYTNATNIEEFVDEVGLIMYERFSTGVVSGGLISDAGSNTINITAGSGYINYNTVKNERITWPEILSSALPFNGDNFVYIDSLGQVYVSQLPPLTGAKIFLGYVYTVQSNTDIGTIAPIRNFVGDFEHRVQSYLDFAIGPISPSGNLVSDVPASLALQISSGKIYNNLNLFNTGDTTNFVKWYNTADFGWMPDVNGANLVNTRHYNDVTKNSFNILSGTSTFTNGSATVSGVGTSYLTEVEVGDYVYLLADTRNFKTLVQSVDSDTQLTLGFVYTGAGGSATGISDKALRKIQVGFWKKDLVVRDMNGVVHYMYSQNEYPTEDSAKEAAHAIIPQAIVQAGVIYLAAIVTENEATDLSGALYDIRPNFQRIFGYGTSGTVGTVADHGALLGLVDDDHPLYFNTDGSDLMEGDLQMNTNNILGATIDGDLNFLSDISISSLKDRNKSIKIRPAFSNMVVFKDGTLNNVTLKQGNDTINSVQYFVLSSNQASLNDIDLVISIQIPEDFVSFQVNPIQLNVKSQHILSSENQIDLSLLDTTKTPVSLTNGTDLHSAVADTWILKNIQISGTPIFTPGSFVTLTAKLHSKSQNKIYISDIILNYIGK